MCLEARPAAESKIGLIMSYSERFISLKMFYSTKSALNICLLLDTINYFSATRMLWTGQGTVNFGAVLETTWGAARIQAQLPSGDLPAARVLLQQLHLLQLMGFPPFSSQLQAAAGLFDVCSGAATRDFLGEERREENEVAWLSALHWAGGIKKCVSNQVFLFISKFPAKAIESQLLFPSSSPFVFWVGKKGEQLAGDWKHCYYKACLCKGCIMSLDSASALSSISWHCGTHHGYRWLMLWQKCQPLSGPNLALP